MASEILAKIRDRIAGKVVNKNDDSAVQPEDSTSSTKVSRRKFLKLSAAAAAYAGLEFKTGLVNNSVLKPFERFLREQNVWTEGNALQFMTILADLLRNYLNEPSEENSKLLEAWVKFNAAIHYAARADMELAASFVNHFLYGEGKDLDIHDSLQNVASAHINQLEPEEKVHLGLSPESSSSEKLLIFLQEAISPHWESSHIYNSEGPFLREEDAPEIYYMGDNLQPLSGKELVVFSVSYCTSPYTMNSFGNLTVGLSGQAVVDGNTLTFARPIFTVRDYYDWELTQDNFGVGTVMGRVLDDLGISELFADPRFDEFKSTLIEINDSDGVLLTEKGFAHPFALQAEFDEFQSAQIEMSVLRSPPEDFIRENDIEVRDLNQTSE